MSESNPKIKLLTTSDFVSEGHNTSKIAVICAVDIDQEKGSNRDLITTEIIFSNTPSGKTGYRMRIVDDYPSELNVCLNMMLVKAASLAEHYFRIFLKEKTEFSTSEFCLLVESTEAEILNQIKYGDVIFDNQNILDNTKIDDVKKLMIKTANISNHKRQQVSFDCAPTSKPTVIRDYGRIITRKPIS